MLGYVWICFGFGDLFFIGIKKDYTTTKNEGPKKALLRDHDD